MILAHWERIGPTPRVADRLPAFWCVFSSFNSGRNLVGLTISGKIRAYRACKKQKIHCDFEEGISLCPVHEVCHQ